MGRDSILLKISTEIDAQKGRGTWSLVFQSNLEIIAGARFGSSGRLSTSFGEWLMRKFSVFAGAVLCLLVSGCAMGNKHQYDALAVDLDFAGSSSVGLAVHDRREYVVSGDKTADFVGLQRGKYGIPFQVKTASGKPLAEEFSTNVGEALREKGFRPTFVQATFRDSRAAVLKRLPEAGSERYLVITIREWKSDTFKRTTLHYELKAEVLDRKGDRIAASRVMGRDNLGGSLWRPRVYAKKVVSKAFREKMTELLQAREIEEALQSGSL